MVPTLPKDYGIDRPELEITCRYSNSRAPGDITLNQHYHPYHSSQQVQIGQGLATHKTKIVPHTEKPKGVRGGG